MWTAKLKHCKNPAQKICTTYILAGFITTIIAGCKAIMISKKHAKTYIRADFKCHKKVKFMAASNIYAEVTRAEL